MKEIINNKEMIEKGIKDQIPAFEQALRAEGLSFICEAITKYAMRILFT